MAHPADFPGPFRVASVIARIRSGLRSVVQGLKFSACVVMFAVDYGCCLARDRHTCSPRSYRLLRRLYATSHGRSQAIMAAPFQWRYPLVPLAAPAKLRGQVEQLDAQGYCGVRDPSEAVRGLCQELREHLSRCPAQEVFGEATVLPGGSRQAARLNYRRDAVAACSAAWQLIDALDLPEVAGLYLRCRPLITSVDCWQVVPIHPSPQAEALYSAAAQTFHYDMDWIKFVKFFIHLTDVDGASGPFEYVSGSHRHKHSAYYSDGRFDRLLGDPEVVVSLGPVGSVFAADTAGLHRDGRARGTASRLVLQVEFAVAAFGAKFQYDQALEACSRAIPWSTLPPSLTRDPRLLCLFQGSSGCC